MENEQLIKELDKLPYEEQLKAYKLPNPEAYLIKRRIEGIKKRLRSFNFFNFGA